jgi:hypothetical protein
MQEDKQNKEIRSSIDGLDQLPEGFAFNSQRAWNGIEEKLPGKKQGKPVWHYAAAAVILLMGVSYFLFLGPSDKNNIETKTTAAISNYPIIPSTRKENKIVGSHSNNLTADKKPTNKKIIDQEILTASNVVKEMNEAEPKKTPVTKSIEEIIIPVTTAESPIKEDKKKPVLIAAKKTEAKKYRIIHLNDLDALPVSHEQSNLTKSEFRKIISQQNEEKEVSQPPAETNLRQLLFLKTKPANTSTIVENN